MRTGWEEFFNGGSLYSQSQDSSMGGLERLLYLLQTRGQDAVMRGMWGEDGRHMPRSSEAPDMWKEMLERQMWQQINQQPMIQRGVWGNMPQMQRGMRSPMPMNVLGRRG